MSECKLAILGITGSIGSQTVQVAQHLGCDIVAASAGRRIEKLQALKDTLGIGVIYSPYGNFDRKAFEEAVYSADAIMVATSDVSEMPFVLKLLEDGKRVAIATKEMLVLGHDLFAPYRWKNLYPVDSEHATVYMLMKPYISLVKEVYLTASGGAFRDLSLNEIDNLSPKDALKHPVWSMGYKITVDSATLANKGIELLEARVLFDIPPSELKAVMHREVIVHAMVVLHDNFTLMGAYKPSMLLPIQFSLTYPDLKESLLKPISWHGQTLHFEDIPTDKYGMYKLAIDVLNTDDKKLYMLYLIADDIVVERYMKEEIRFSQMPWLAEKIIDTLSENNIPYQPEERIFWYRQMKERAKEVAI
ncbi:hypothetical protein [Zhurongbacter thermophilus]